MPSVQRITPCLWFDQQAEEAATFYIGVFKNSKISHISCYGDAGQEVHGQKPGSVMLGQAVGRRSARGPAVRLAQGPIRRVMASRAARHGRADDQRRPGQVQPRHERHAEDEKN